MTGISNGGGYFQIDNPDDKQAIERYRKAVIEALAIFESAVKLAVRSGDRVGLESIKDEVRQIIERAELTIETRKKSK